MTLIELVVALAISVLVMGAVFWIYKSQHMQYTRQSTISAIQQEARAALFLLSRDIRMAGFLCQEGDEFLNGTFKCGINPVNNDGAPDEITIVYASELLEGVKVMEIAGERVTLTGNPGNSVSAENEGKSYVAFEGLKKAFKVENISGTQLELKEAPRSYIADYNAQVYGIRVITYKVVNKVLKRDDHTGGGAQPVIGDERDFPIVQDLQFRYFVNGVWTDSPTDPYKIRAVEISLHVRTPRPDPETGEIYDRTFTTTVQVRNMGGAS